MTLPALELRRHRSACYAAPCAADLVLQAVVFVAIVDIPQPPSSPDILGQGDDHEAHDGGNHNHCYGLDHEGRYGRLWLLRL